MNQNYHRDYRTQPLTNLHRFLRKIKHQIMDDIRAIEPNQAIVMNMQTKLNLIRQILHLASHYRAEK